MPRWIELERSCGGPRACPLRCTNGAILASVWLERVAAVANTGAFLRRLSDAGGCSRRPCLKASRAERSLAANRLVCAACVACAALGQRPTMTRYRDLSDSNVWAFSSSRMGCTTGVRRGSRGYAPLRKVLCVCGKPQDFRALSRECFWKSRSCPNHRGVLETWSRRFTSFLNEMPMEHVKRVS